MIELNLLPKRYRQVESTPLKIATAVFTGIILVAAAAICLAYFYFIALSELQQKIDNTSVKISTKKTQIAQLGNVDEQWLIQKTRKDTVVKLFKSRMLVWPKLARLQELVPDTIQIEGIEMTTATTTAKKKGTGGVARYFRIKGAVRIPYDKLQDLMDKQRMTELTAFMVALQNDAAFYKHCVGDIMPFDAIVKEYRDDAFYYEGEDEPYEVRSIPVYIFGIQAIAVFFEQPAKKAGSK